MDNTKSKILEAAVEVFVKKGFSGSSISEIAKTAGINQSLIYHHIGNKQDLWKAAKTSLIHEELIKRYQISEIDEVQEFLGKIIDQRLELYATDRRILRLMQWQNLEDSTEELIGGSLIAPTSWIGIIQNFQNQGKVTKDYPAEFFAIFIHGSINELIFDSFHVFAKDERKKEKYILMLKKNLVSFLEN